MDKQKLLKSASDLKQPSKQCADEFISKGDKLAAEMNKIMTNRSDVKMMVGDNNISMMEDNHRNHIRFLSSVFTSYEPEILVETVLWVYRAYRNHGFNLSYWPAQLDQWVQIFKTELTDECFKEVYPFYNWMIINQPIFVAESDKLVLGNESPKH
jgi:hypothetical protein